jgi:Spx/MgsR family transcriptional regulator
MTKPVRKTTRRVKKPAKTVQFLHKPTCATCRKARHFMEKHGYHLNFRDITKNKLSAAELEKLIGKRNPEEFLNPRSELYRETDMKENPPSRRAAISMMAKNPDLIRRPVVVAGGRVVIGYDEKGMIRF